MPVREGLNSDDEDDLAEHIAGYYEERGENPEEIIRKVEDASHIPQSIRDIIEQREVGTLIGETFERLEPIGGEPRAVGEYKEENWNFERKTEEITVRRTRDGRFAKGKRIVRSVVEAVFPQGTSSGSRGVVIEEDYEPPEVGEEYKNEVWSYPEQDVEYSVPRDTSGKFLKGHRVKRGSITQAIILDQQSYEQYQEYGATQ